MRLRPFILATLALSLAAVLLSGAALAQAGNWSRPRSADAAGSDTPDQIYYFPLVFGSAPPPVVFTHGVASGDVSATGAVLWTRVDRPLTLVLEIATDANFESLALRRQVAARAQDDFTARLDVHSLAPDQMYYFRWRHIFYFSPTGSFRTAPLPATPASLRFAWSGDSDGTPVMGQPFYGQFELLDAIRGEGVDFFIYLGDTIYADSGLRADGPARTLAEYRDAYKVNRDIAALPNLLAATSMVTIWDDHEVLNDFAGQTVDPARYANGRRAFLDYMPLRQDDLPHDPTCAGRPLFRVLRWGSLVDLIVLDQRSCRSAQAIAACTPANTFQTDLAPMLPAAARLALGLPATPPFGCREAINDPGRTMLGPVQKELFKEALRSSTATYKFVVNQVPIQQFYAYPYDRWEGYGAERAEILNFIRDQGIENVIFLTTDVHANFSNDVYIDLFTDPQPMAYDLAAGPIATGTFEQGLRRAGGQALVDRVHNLFDLIGIRCRQLDVFAYGLVEVDAASGRATISYRDESGNILPDLAAPGQFCVKTFDP